MKNSHWFKIVRSVLWHVPRPIVCYDRIRLGLETGTAIRLLGLTLARGDWSRP